MGIKAEGDRRGIGCVDSERVERVCVERGWRGVEQRRGGGFSRSDGRCRGSFGVCVDVVCRDGRGGEKDGGGMRFGTGEKGK